MSRYLYKKIQNISPESLNFQHSGLKLTTLGLDWDNMCAVANAVNYMREAGKLVFIITHDLEFISLTASRALLLKEGIIKDDLQMTEQNNFKIVKNFMVEEGGE